MKTGISKITVDFNKEFISTLDKWKGKILLEGLKVRLEKLIRKDLKGLERSKQDGIY